MPSMVDVSQATIDSYWRSLLAAYQLTDDSLEIDARLERGEEVTTESYTQEQLEIARERTQDEVDGMLRKPIKLAAQKFAPNWEITEQEIDELVPLYSQLVAKYYPELYATPLWSKLRAIITGAGTELLVVWKTYRLFSKRKGVPLKKPKEKAQPKQEQHLTAEPAIATDTGKEV